MCQLTNSLTGNGILSQAAQVISAAQTAASTAQTISSVASLLHHFSGSTDQPSKSFASHIASVLNSGGGSGSSQATHAGDEPGQVASGSSNFNPVLAVLDFLASNSHEKSAVSTLLPARRKKPMDLEELASEATASITPNKVPPTPCPSLEVCLVFHGVTHCITIFPFQTGVHCTRIRQELPGRFHNYFIPYSLANFLFSLLFHRLLGHISSNTICRVCITNESRIALFLLD